MRIKKRLERARARASAFCFVVKKESSHTSCTNIFFYNTLNNFQKSSGKKRCEDTNMEAANFEAKEAAQKRARELLPWYAKMWLTCTCR